MNIYAVGFYNMAGDCLVSIDNVEAWSRFEAMIDYRCEISSEQYTWDADIQEEYVVEEEYRILFTSPRTKEGVYSQRFIEGCRKTSLGEVVPRDRSMTEVFNTVYSKNYIQLLKERP